MTARLDCQAALLTPVAPGAIGVVGLAGPQVDWVLRAVLRRLQADAPPELLPDRPALCRVYHGDMAIDDAVVVRFEHAGRSMAEISTHGGVRIVQRLLQALSELGVAIVPANELPDFSVSDEPILRDIDAALLRCQSRRLTLWLLAQRQILPPFLEKWPDYLPEEQVAFIERSRIACRLLGGIRIALIGPPNAGKSTLANLLIGRPRVVTSDMPGTTRDWVSETAFIQGWPITLTDTAGIRSTDCQIEVEAIRRGRSQAEQAHLRLLVLDGSQSEQRLVDDAAEVLGPLLPDVATIVALNKIDRCIPNRRESRLLGRLTVGISALRGDGLPILEAEISRALGLERLEDHLPAAFQPSQLPP